MLKLWDLITTRSITEAAFLVTQLLPHQDRGKSVLHQHNVAIRQSEMRAEALKPSPKRCQILPLCNSAVKSDGLDSSRFARF